MAYASIAELRMQTDKQGTTGTGNVENLQLLLDASTEAINAFCNRPDGFLAPALASARVYSGNGKPFMWVDECAAITLVECKDSITDVSYTAWAPTDWMPFTGDPQSPDFNRTPYQGIMIVPGQSRSYFLSGSSHGAYPWGGDSDHLQSHGVPTVRVTARWGYALVCPDRIKECCLIQAARWLKRGESSWADSLASSDLGQIMYTKELDPDVRMMLEAGRLVKPMLGRR